MRLPWVSRKEMEQACEEAVEQERDWWLDRMEALKASGYEQEVITIMSLIAQLILSESPQSKRPGW